MAETLPNGTVIPQGADLINSNGVQAARNMGASVDAALGSRSLVGHTHTAAQVTDLAAALSAKADIAPIDLTGSGIDLDSFTTTMGAVVGSNTWALQGSNFPEPRAGRLQVVASPSGMVWQVYSSHLKTTPTVHVRTWWNGWGAWRALIMEGDNRLTDSRNPRPHNHPIANITGLQTALNGKAAAAHNHPIANITGLQTALNGKAAAAHTHTMGQVDGLDGALASKIDGDALDARLAGIASSYDVARAEGFPGTVTEWLASLKGDRGPEGPYGGTEITDPQVASYVTTETATRAVMDARYRRDVSPVDYGAVGDGIADDTAAVRAALESGAPVHWGGAGRVYRVTEPVTVNLGAPLVWRADGATIRGDFPEPVERMLTINANGHPVAISGVTFDAARSAFTILRIWSRYTTAPACVLTDVTALNGHRASTEFPGGDGIVVAGAWDRVTLTRPTVKNMTLAAGAGVSGAYGVGGIYVHDILRADGDYDTPHIVNIADPYVENIHSEDPAYQDDQDGIKVFGGREAAGQTAPIRTHATITGGEVRNALGRAFKAQVEMATVDGLRVVRTMGGKGKGQDLDFQIGGGTVRNLECVYIDAAPPTVINFSGSRTAGRTLPQKQVAGLKVAIQGAVAPDWLVSVLSQQEQEVSATINDISVATNGAVPGHLLRMSGTTEARQRVVLANAVAPVATAAVAADGGSPDGWDGTLVATGLVNPGTVKPLIAAGSLSRVITTHAGLSGFTT